MIGLVPAGSCAPGAGVAAGAIITELSEHPGLENLTQSGRLCRPVLELLCSPARALLVWPVRVGQLSTTRRARGWAPTTPSDGGRPEAGIALSPSWRTSSIRSGAERDSGTTLRKALRR